MSEIRLAVVTETFLPDVNGVATSLQQLLSALPPRFQIQLIRTRPANPWQGQFDEVSCPGFRLPLYPDVCIGLPARRRIRSAWRSFRPDLVYIATEGPLGNSARQEAQRLGIPVISAFHTNFHRYSGYYGMGWIQALVLRWLRRFHNRTACTLVPAEDVAISLLQEGFERVLVLPHGVDSERFHPRHRSAELRRQWRADENAPVLLFVGRLAAEKNIPLAIRTWQALRQDVPALRLVLVGDGPLRASLERDHPEVVLAGIRTGDDLAAHFASADVFVFPSLTETFGLVTLEAMASGLPVAAFDMAAAARFVSAGQSGELAAAGDEDAFIAAARRVLQRHSTGSGQQSRQAAEQADWFSVARRFEGLCDNLLHSSADAAVRQFGLQSISGTPFAETLSEKSSAN